MPVGLAGSEGSGSVLRRFAAFLTDRAIVPAPKVPQPRTRWKHLDAFLH